MSRIVRSKAVTFYLLQYRKITNRSMENSRHKKQRQYIFSKIQNYRKI